MEANYYSATQRSIGWWNIVGMAAMTLISMVAILVANGL
jgi:hypothetical protein